MRWQWHSHVVQTAKEQLGLSESCFTLSGCPVSSQADNSNSSVSHRNTSASWKWHQLMFNWLWHAAADSGKRNFHRNPPSSSIRQNRRFGYWPLGVYLCLDHHSWDIISRSSSLYMHGWVCIAFLYARFYLSHFRLCLQWIWYNINILYCRNFVSLWYWS